MSVASAHVAQVNGDAVDIEKIREFADLISQLAPTLGLGPDQQQCGADELHAAARSAPEVRGPLPPGTR